MKLFQIEEPDGSPRDSDGPGVAVGIELSAKKGAAVAVAVGGNAEVLQGREGLDRLAMAPLDDAAALQGLLLQLRERAEKAMARPVTHAVVALEAPEAARETLTAAAEGAGLSLLRLIETSVAAALAKGAAAADAPVLGAAIQAEDDAAPLAR